MKLSLSVLTIATTLLATAAALPLGPTINGPILNEESGPVLNTDGPVLNVREGPVLQFGPVLNAGEGPVINGPILNEEDGPVLQDGEEETGPIINGPILNVRDGPILNEDETGPILNEDEEGPILNGPILQCATPTHPCSLYGSLPHCSPAWHAILDLCMQSGCIQWIRNPKEECPPIPIRGDLGA
jgi:hypothetical protein